MSGFTLDAGALIAWERGDRAAVLLLTKAIQSGDGLSVPAGVVGQVWLLRRPRAGR